MTHIEPNYTCTQYAYPGQYVPPLLTIDEVMEELQKPHEVASKPLINVADAPDAFVIEVAAPGLNCADFYVSITNNVLAISVLHKDPDAGSRMYQQHEFNYCCFKRDISLPANVDADFLYATYKNGLLHIRLPKSNVPVLNHTERIIIY